MVLDSTAMATAKIALENVSDEKLHHLMKAFLKSLDPMLLKAARRGSTNVTFTDEQLFHSLSSTTNDIAQKFVEILRFLKEIVGLFLVRNYLVVCIISSMMLLVM